MAIGMLRAKRIKQYLLIGILLIGSSFLCYLITSQRNNFNAELIVISTTYYNISSYYPNNTAVILLNARANLSPKIVWKCYSKNATGSSQNDIVSPSDAFKIQPHCEMQTYLVNCNTVPNPTFISLLPPDFTQIKDTRSMVSFPIRKPIREKFSVVSCLSPLFLNERWQLNVLSIELYSFFGVSKQVYYVMSILENGFKLLKEYENLELIDIRPWMVPKIVLQNGNVPLRTNVEYRNQAAAHQDCYLLYRESAQFIITHDPDDILLPAFTTDLYSEFMLQTRIHPLASSFVYSRMPAELSTPQITDFKNNVPKILNSIQLTNENAEKFDKSVHITSRVESTWIHFSYLHTAKYPLQTLEKSNGFFVHLRDWQSSTKNNDSSFFNAPTQNIPYWKKMSSKQLSTVMENRFLQFSKKGLLSILKPMTDYYYDVIDSCYDYLKKSRSKTEQCPTHYRCKIPQIDNVVCIQAAHSVPLEEHVIDPLSMTIYVSRHEPIFTASYQGCLVN